MPAWLFIVCILVFVILVWFFMPRWKYWAVFESPDTALAYIAIFIGFVLLFQQVTDYRHGVIYMLSSETARAIFDNPSNTIQSEVVGAWRFIMIAAYWFFFAGGIIGIVALIRGTINKAREKDDLTELIESINGLTNEIRQVQKNATTKD